MAKSSNFLPESVSVALKGLVKRIVGVAFLGIGAWALFALLFLDPYLNGFAAASTFGQQSFMGQVVGFLRYFVGFLPALFIILCVARLGLVWLVNWEEDFAPEYNFLRAFVTVCLGAVGFGLLAPSSTFGGMLGYIAAADVGAVLGGWGLLLGISCVALFFILGALLLHIKWVHIKSLFGFIWRAVRWLLSIFRLVPATKEDVAEEDADDEIPDEDEEEQEKTEEAKPTHRRQRKSARNVKITFRRIWC